MFVHLLSKEARFRIVKLVVDETGDQEMAAGILGVSRTAVYKFLSGRTHASDRVVMRALDYLRAKRGAGWAEAVKLVTGELTRALDDFAKYSGLRVQCRTYNTILEVIA